MAPVEKQVGQLFHVVQVLRHTVLEHDHHVGIDLLAFLRVFHHPGDQLDLVLLDLVHHTGRIAVEDLVLRHELLPEAVQAGIGENINPRDLFAQVVEHPPHSERLALTPLAEERHSEVGSNLVEHKRVDLGRPFFEWDQPQLAGICIIFGHLDFAQLACFFFLFGFRSLWTVKQRLWWSVHRKAHTVRTGFFSKVFCRPRTEKMRHSTAHFGLNRRNATTPIAYPFTGAPGTFEQTNVLLNFTDARGDANIANWTNQPLIKGPQASLFRKFKAPPDPMKAERGKGFEAPPNVMYKKKEEVYDALLSQAGTDPAKRTAIEIAKRQNLDAAVTAEVNEDFTCSFNNWLLKRGRRQDHIAAGWWDPKNPQTVPKFIQAGGLLSNHPSVHSYVKDIVLARSKFEQKLVEMKMEAQTAGVNHWPVDKLYLYYKYVVRGMEPDDTDVINLTAPPGFLPGGPSPPVSGASAPPSPPASSADPPFNPPPEPPSTNPPQPGWFSSLFSGAGSMLTRSSALTAPPPLPPPKSKEDVAKEKAARAAEQLAIQQAEEKARLEKEAAVAAEHFERERVEAERIRKQEEDEARERAERERQEAELQHPPSRGSTPPPPEPPATPPREPSPPPPEPESSAPPSPEPVSEPASPMPEGAGKTVREVIKRRHDAYMERTEFIISHFGDVATRELSQSSVNALIHNVEYFREHAGQFTPAENKDFANARILATLGQAYIDARKLYDEGKDAEGAALVLRIMNDLPRAGGRWAGVSKAVVEMARQLREGAKSKNFLGEAEVKESSSEMPSRVELTAEDRTNIAFYNILERGASLEEVEELAADESLSGRQQKRILSAYYDWVLRGLHKKITEKGIEGLDSDELTDLQKLIAVDFEDYPSTFLPETQKLLEEEVAGLSVEVDKRMESLRRKKDVEEVVNSIARGPPITREEHRRLEELYPDAVFDISLAYHESVIADIQNTLDFGGVDMLSNVQLGDLVVYLSVANRSDNFWDETSRRLDQIWASFGPEIRVANAEMERAISEMEARRREAPEPEPKPEDVYEDDPAPSPFASGELTRLLDSIAATPPPLARSSALDIAHTAKEKAKAEEPKKPIVPDMEYIRAREEDEQRRAMAARIDQLETEARVAKEEAETKLYFARREQEERDKDYARLQEIEKNNMARERERMQRIYDAERQRAERLAKENEEIIKRAEAEIKKAQEGASKKVSPDRLKQVQEESAKKVAEAQKQLEDEKRLSAHKLSLLTKGTRQVLHKEMETKKKLEAEVQTKSNALGSIYHGIKEFQKEHEALKAKLTESEAKGASHADESAMFRKMLAEKTEAEADLRRQYEERFQREFEAISAPRALVTDEIARIEGILRPASSTDSPLSSSSSEDARLRAELVKLQKEKDQLTARLDGLTSSYAPDLIFRATGPTKRQPFEKSLYAPEESLFWGDLPEAMDDDALAGIDLELTSERKRKTHSTPPDFARKLREAQAREARLKEMRETRSYRPLEAPLMPASSLEAPSFVPRYNRDVLDAFKFTGSPTSTLSSTGGIGMGVPDARTVPRPNQAAEKGRYYGARRRK